MIKNIALEPPPPLILVQTVNEEAEQKEDSTNKDAKETPSSAKVEHNNTNGKCETVEEMVEFDQV